MSERQRKESHSIIPLFLLGLVSIALLAICNKVSGTQNPDINVPVGETVPETETVPVPVDLGPQLLVDTLDFKKAIPKPLLLM